MHGVHDTNVNELRSGSFRGVNGRDLTYFEVGAGRPIVLLHGFIASGRQWFDHGPATALCGAGYRVILPTLRGHGDRPAPHDAASYPPDVLTDDALALVEHLQLDAYDLGGYSLGAKTVLHMLARGAAPQRAIVAGQGLSAVTNAAPRGRYRRVLSALATGEAMEQGSADEDTAGWVTALGGDPQALLLVLDSLVPLRIDELAMITIPVLVVVGTEDTEHVSAKDLAAHLPHAQFATVPGNHWTALTGPELTTVVTAFLDGRR